MKKIICLILFTLSTVNCSFTKDTTKYIVVTFVSYNNFPKEYLEEVEIKFTEYIKKEFNIITHIEFEQESFPKQNKRLDALKLLNKYQSNYYFTTILFTDKDIEFKGKGVLGLSLHPGKLCIVSTYRLKNKKELWKLVVHEFIHIYFDYSHCPVNNNNCLMKDAKGKVNFKNKQNICTVCKNNITNYKI